MNLTAENWEFWQRGAWNMFNQFDCVRLKKHSMIERSIVFDWQNFWANSIMFDFRTQSKPIVRLNSIGFDYRTFDWLRRALLTVANCWTRSDYVPDLTLYVWQKTFLQTWLVHLLYNDVLWILCIMWDSNHTTVPTILLCVSSLLLPFWWCSSTVHLHKNSSWSELSVTSDDSSGLSSGCVSPSRLSSSVKCSISSWLLAKVWLQGSFAERWNVHVLSGWTDSWWWLVLCADDSLFTHLLFWLEEEIVFGNNQTQRKHYTGKCLILQFLCTSLP